MTLTTMKINKILLGVLAVMGLTAPAMAQNLQSGYFLDNYTYRYQINPAFGGTEKHGFVSLPGLGNLNVATHGNIGLNHFLYKVDGGLTTFLNPKVDAATFMNGLKDRNRVGVSLRETILATGFRGMKGYNTITVSARADAGVFVPKDLFGLAKEGVANKTYNIGTMGVDANAWAEIALNHSHSITKNLRIGVTAKVLVGGANVDARFNKAELALSEDNWTATVDADIKASVKGLRYKTERNENTGRNYVSGAEVNGAGIGGYGVAVDLGATYTIKGLEVSASVLDLGAIDWKSTQLATTDGPQTVQTDKYTFDVNDMDPTLDKLRDDVSNLYQLTDKGDVGSRRTMLPTIINVGARYSLPFYNKLNAGVLFSSRIQGDYSAENVRVSLNFQPAQWFGLGVNTAMGTYGTSFGGIVNLKAPGFNFFVASDCLPSKLAKQGVPLNSNLNLNMGVNIPF